MGQWFQENSIDIKISPGESHTRLALLERRHHAATTEAMIPEFCYVIPQVNRMPNVSGYLPVQWAMGYKPHIPGLLMDEQISPVHLDPSEAFREKMELQTSTSKARKEANIDAKLRRALLRRFTGQPAILNTGDR
eukprot:s503_g4.t1